jgi:acetate kinase
MESNQRHILTINGGSSSIKFALYNAGKCLTRIFNGQTENVGPGKNTLRSLNWITGEKKSIELPLEEKNDIINPLVNWLEKQEGFPSVKAIGHRIVYGMQYDRPELISPGLLDELKGISMFDPEHLPEEIKLIEVIRDRYPEIPQIACFDTSFHSTMPAVAKMLSIPRRYQTKKIRRYGFHGISYAFLLEEFTRLRGIGPDKDRIVFAHLGNGASLAAVKNGKSMDTSMGFTPSAGIPMGTRSGDLDPGVAWYLMQSEKLSPVGFGKMINQESGLLGISETNSDMRELLKLQATDYRASEAIEFFCYQTKKWIGSFAAVLGGLDFLLFSGGIGENSPEIRTRICKGLEFLGIELDESRNQQNETIISSRIAKTPVYVIKTNEELMIAKMVCEKLNYCIKT